MLKKQHGHYDHIEKQYKSELESDVSKDEIQFDWSDTLAFTIATFQVIFPYALALAGSYAVIMLLFSLLLGRN
ncbi:hypothetical protein [Alkaliphilus metalliredigens]|nr:hypothetical protein [Alkaliphilus metalliredigens]